MSTLKLIPKNQKGNKLPTAQSADERYQKGTYEKNKYFVSESVTAPLKIAHTNPARITLKVKNNNQDSTITEVPTAGEVRVKKRIASNNGKDQKEWEIMRRRWETAKKVSTHKN